MGTTGWSTNHKAAVVMDGYPTLTFAELESQSNQLAHLFRERGLVAGDHIAFVMENRPEFFVVAWAAQRSGLYYTACSTRLAGEELSYVVRDCGARLLLVSESTASLAESIVPDLPNVGVRLIVGHSRPEFEGLAELLIGLPPSPISDEQEGSDMLYSSGTTGRPKGVLNRLSACPFPAMSKVGRLCSDLFKADESTVYLSPAPLYHAAPLRYCMAMHRLGATVIVMDHFDPQRFLDLVEEHRVTMTQVVPTMLIRLLKLPDEVRRRVDLSSLKVVVHSAAPCPTAVKEAAIDWLGPILHEYYAGTEGNAFVYCDSGEWLAHRGTVGRSMLGAVHVLDENGAELPAMQIGTIYFEGPSFSYHNDHEKTAGSRDPSGRWSTLGDIGYVDADGFIFLTDRQAFMIISGGVNIYPREAEDALVVHPAVADVAVFGVPDEDMGERVHAVVQLQPGDEPSDELAAELIAHCRSRISAVKCPRSIEFRAELPRYPTGKLFKRLLRDEHWPSRGDAH